MKIVVLLGPPGAGKGTVAEVLAERGYIHLSTGQLIREEMQRGSRIGKEAEQLLKVGGFSPDKDVLELVSTAIKKSKGDYFTLDGFPRTLVQANALEGFIAANDANLVRVVVLECDEEEIVRRLSGRRSCSVCGNVYHLEYNPPVNSGRCDADGAELIQRRDDVEDVIKQRMVIYGQRTKPLVEFYERKGLVTRVNANQPINAVRGAVLELAARDWI